MAVSRHFMFLEFTNPEVLSLLTSVRDTFYGEPQRDPVHVTVRGPYKDLPSQQSLENQASALKGDFVMLKDVGMFETGKGYAIFLNAYSRIFEKIWWKPDFRNERKRPHLTLFETNDLREANETRRFLESEMLEIVTYALDLTVYTSRQRTLWRDHQVSLPDGKQSSMDRVCFKADIVERAKQLSEYLRDPKTRPAFQLSLV